MKNRSKKREEGQEKTDMKITFYHSALCPRCLLVRRVLQKLQEEYLDLVVEKIDVTARPVDSLRKGIRIIPTLTAEGQKKLSGIILTPDAVREFVEKIYRGRQWLI
jgi:thiol-disulfide isomerase/thioredoxin